MHIRKNGRDVAGVLSAEQYAALTADAGPNLNPLIVKLRGESMKRWGKVYQVLAK